MPNRTIDDQLTKYLADVHSIEVQAEAQMKAAPDLAGSERLARAFREHLRETEEHEQLVRAQLEARGADTATLKDLAGRAGGWAMVAFAKLNPDTPGKLAAHAYSYEHMELAAYELLERAARRAREQPVIDLARRIGAQERAMAERIEACFDDVAQASLDAKDEDPGEALVSYLTDARALEAQAEQLLQSGQKIAGVDALADAFADHLEETREHQRLVEERLAGHDGKASRVQDTALRVGAGNLGGFFAAQPDTPVKLAGFAFAFEHLEIAGYELLCRVAERAGDAETATVAREILAQERRAAARIAGTWDAAMDASLGRLVGEGVG